MVSNQFRGLLIQVVEAVAGVNVVQMNSATVYGDGSSGNLWRGTP